MNSDNDMVKFQLQTIKHGFCRRAVSVWLGVWHVCVCLSVCHVRVLCRNGYSCYRMRIGNRTQLKLKLSNGTIFSMTLNDP